MPAERGALAAVAFDLMDTVIRDPYREALEAATERPLREVFRHKDPEAWPAFERGDLTEEEYFAAFGDLDLDVEAFHRARREGYEVLPGMRELLDDLAGQVLRVTASNYPVWVDDVVATLLEGSFDRVLASHHLGVRKPKPAFYESLCAELELVPGAVLFVDDRDDNVAAAREAGLRTHPFAGADDLRQRLRDEGLAV